MYAPRICSSSVPFRVSATNPKNSSTSTSLHQRAKRALVEAGNKQCKASLRGLQIGGQRPASNLLSCGLHCPFLSSKSSSLANTHVPTTVSIIGIEEDLGHLLVDASTSNHHVDELLPLNATVLSESKPSLRVLFILSDSHYTKMTQRNGLEAGEGENGARKARKLNALLYLECFAFLSTAGVGGAPCPDAAGAAAATAGGAC